MAAVTYSEEKLSDERMLKESRQLINKISSWLKTNGYYDQQIQEIFKHAEARFSRKTCTVLFLSEFSRGKSELINSIIFGSSGLQVLPSTPGRTTCCTTVIQYDPEEPLGLRLLHAGGLAEKQDDTDTEPGIETELWEDIFFPSENTEMVFDAMQHTIKTELVSPQLAQKLGYVTLVDDKVPAYIDLIDGNVAVPKYRRAILNYPHPLLNQRLSIIDTSGLNTMGPEPENIRQSLEEVDIIVFILSIDTGISRSEYEIWNTYIKPLYKKKVFVVINKIDTLWDDFRNQPEIDSLISKQTKEVARMLEIPGNRVFPLSAQKSLAARRKKNKPMETASRILEFEQVLADTANSAKYRNMTSRISTDIDTALQIVERLITQRRDTTREQLEEFKKNPGKNSGIPESNLNKIDREKKSLEQASQKINLLRVDIKVDCNNFLGSLDTFYLDKLISRYRIEAEGQLSVRLQQEMHDFLLKVVEKFEGAVAQITSLKIKLEKLYQQVGEILHSGGLTLRRIHPEIHLEVLQKYHREHIAQEQNLPMKPIEQNPIKMRDHISMLVRIRKIYSQVGNEVDLWCRNVLVPLELEVREKSHQLQKRQQSLQRVQKKDSDMAGEIKVLNSGIVRYQSQLEKIDEFHQQLDELPNKEKPDK